MIHTQDKFTRNTHRAARHYCKHFSIILFLGTAGVPTYGQKTLCMTEPSQVVGESSTPLLTSLGTQDAVLNATLNLIISLLDEIIGTQSPEPFVSLANSPLSQTSNTLIISYDTSGIDPLLSQTEINDGLSDCDEALAILKESASDLSLTESESLELDSAIKSIKGDLSNAL